jgi:hypothetical protein
LERRETLEEGRKIKQKQEKEKKRLDVIKASKLHELINLDINKKYLSDLEKYKIK